MDAIVLAGGGGRRLGGADKAGLEVGGRTFLERVLASLSAADEVVVVGPNRASRRSVRWAREDPPGAGPVAALAEGLRHVQAELVAVAAVDHPFLSPETFAQLAAAAQGRDGAILVDDEGRDQYLVGVYKADALRAALVGREALRGAIARLDLARVVDARASSDIDTAEDLMEARKHVR